VHIGCVPNFCGIDGVFAADLGAVMVNERTKGRRISVTGTVHDGTGTALKDAMVEIWQADAAGLYPSPQEHRGQADPDFAGWGRKAGDYETGEWMFETIKPGPVPFPDGRMQAPHITFWVVARGINIGLQTRMYFPEEAEANAADPVLGRIEHQNRVPTLIAERTGDDAYRFDIRLQGGGETSMGDPCIICVAITGSVPTKHDNPAVPITVPEQIESTHEAFEAGASICHAHVRNDDMTTTSDPEKFARLKEGLKKHCPGMIVQFSTGGRSGAGHERGGMLSLRPDMASLTVGSNNFPTRIYENSPDLVDWLASEMLDFQIKPEIEAFDLSHIFQAVKMAGDGRLQGPLYIQFVMGVKNAMPVDRAVFDFYVETVERIAPDAQWCGAGIGAGQIRLNEWCISRGGHVRTGLEDNVRLDRKTLAPSNGALVTRAADLCARYDRPVATPAEARDILGLRGA